MTNGLRTFVVVVTIAPWAMPETAVVCSQASGTSVSGRGTFELYCSPCHGLTAKGDGPLAGSLRKRPPDLTSIARRHGGDFPAAAVTRIIDGRSPAKGHGGDMPVWGDAFARSSADGSGVDETIRALVRYIESVQMRPE